jgi:hypothetical protein
MGGYPDLSNHLLGIMTRAHRRWVVAGIIAGGLLLTLAAGFCALYFLSWPERALQRNALSLLGKPEAVVLAKMGKPDQVVLAAEVAAHPERPWWNPGGGWQPVPTRPVTNKVLLYYRFCAGAYIYISPGGVVDYVHLVGT